jgi:hypothetical protein
VRTRRTLIGHGSFSLTLGIPEWIAQWNTTTLPNGTYRLRCVAVDIDGRRTCVTTTITVNNQRYFWATGDRRHRPQNCGDKSYGQAVVARLEAQLAGPLAAALTPRMNSSDIPDIPVDGPLA